MFSKKEIIIFFAGAAALHTINHLFIQYAGVLPLNFFSITLTEQLNMVAIIASGLLTAVLLWWASRL